MRGGSLPVPPLWSVSIKCHGTGPSGVCWVPPDRGIVGNRGSEEPRLALTMPLLTWRSVFQL